MLEWFARTTRRLDRISIWVSAGVGMWAAMSWLATKLSVFGILPWPEAVFIGLAATLVIGLATAAFSALRRAGRPLTPPADPLPFLDHTELDQVRGEIGSLRTEIENLSTSVDEAIAPMHEAHEKLDGLVHTAINLQGERFDKIEKAHGLLDAKVSRIIDDYQRMLAFKADAEAELRELKAQADQARESFAALQCREAMHKVATRIEGYAKELYDPLHKGEEYNDERWQEWERTHGSWEAMLLIWIQNAQWYAYNLKERIYTLHDSKFGGKWSISDSQFPAGFPASEAVRRFKRFRIIHTQWEEVRKEAESGVDQVAYVGMSPKEVRRRRNDD